VDRDKQRRSEEVHEQFSAAVSHHTTIGNALGMLMERYGIDHDAAFARLRDAASVRERSVYDVAVDLVANGLWPEDQVS
jgi:AmiR/NasT family two-component response regulator